MNNAYVRGPDGIDWRAYFARVDVGADIEARLAEIPSQLPAMRECIANAQAPFDRTRAPVQLALRLRLL